MSLRINHNTAAVNSWRNLEKTDRAMEGTLERLSSGYRINRAADDPAGLVISEQMRARVRSMEQAALNSEMSISMVRTAEASMAEVGDILTGMRQLALHAANEGGNDDAMLAADQAEIENSLATVDRIANRTKFGSRTLLDGGNGVSGMAVGEGLRFVRSEVSSQSSPAEGYAVDVTRTASKSWMEGSRGLSREEIESGGVEISLYEGGRNVSYVCGAGEEPEAVANGLRRLVRERGLALEVELTGEGRLRVEHLRYGSEPDFGAAVSAAGILAREAHELERSEQGRDVRGTVGGEAAYGTGRLLTAAEGTRAAGTVVEYSGGLKTVPRTDAEGNPLRGEDGEPLPPEEKAEGAVYVSNGALSFQIGPDRQQSASVSLPALGTGTLARGVETDSGYASLGEIDVTTLQGAQDALAMIDRAIQEVSSARGELGAFQKNALESSLESLRYASENLAASESKLRDADMAAEMSRLVKRQILMSSGTAMLAQANQTPKSVLSLLNGQ